MADFFGWLPEKTDRPRFCTVNIQKERVRVETDHGPHALRLPKVLVPLDKIMDVTFTPTAENVVWLCVVLVQAGTLVRLVRNGLFRTYRMLAAYLYLGPARFMAFLALPASKNAYAWLFLISQPIMWLLESLVLLELCRLILQNHTGLWRFGRWVVGVSLTAALLISAVTAAPGIGHEADRYRVLFYYTAAERIFDIAMVLFLLAITGFLSWFSFTLNRNILVYFAGWTCSFLASAGAVIMPFATGHRVTPQASLALEIISGICVLGWSLLIGPRGERSSTGPHYRWLPAHREKARAQLEAMNLVLSKSQRPAH